MSLLEQELRSIWERYEPQRLAERRAVEIQETARRELSELNTRRLACGLPSVTEYRETSMQQFAMQAQFVQTTPAKTWRDEMNESMLAAIRKHMT